MTPLIYSFQVIVKILYTFQKSEVSSANILEIENMSQSKSFIYMRKRSCPNNNLCGTRAGIFPKKN